MNIFRFFGDLSHLASILILVYTIEHNRSTEGLSVKTQALYLLVFVARYYDLFYKFYSVYNTIMKIVLIASSGYVLHLMTVKYRRTIQEKVDLFPTKYLLGAAAVLSLIFTHSYSFRQVTWSFSAWLEAGAILPQFFLLQKSGDAQNITVHYIFALGLYRALYIPNWIYRYFVEDQFDWVAVLAGVVQTAVYSDFFYVYYTKVLHGKKFSLPV